MTNRYNISCYKDLEREEIRVKKRIKLQEQEIRSQFKKLPEELVITGVSHLVTSFGSGKLVDMGGRVVKRIITHFVNKNDSEGEPSGLKKMLFGLLEKFISKNKE